MMRILKDKRINETGTLKIKFKESTVTNQNMIVLLKTQKSRQIFLNPSLHLI